MNKSIIRSVVRAGVISGYLTHKRLRNSTSSKQYNTFQVKTQVPKVAYIKDDCTKFYSALNCNFIQLK